MGHFFQYKTFKILVVMLITAFIIGFCMVDCEVEQNNDQMQLENL